MFEHSFFEQKCPGCGITLENSQHRMVKNADGNYSCPACGIALKLNPKVWTGFVLIAPVMLIAVLYLAKGIHMPGWLFALTLITALAGMGMVVTHLGYVRKE